MKIAFYILVGLHGIIHLFGFLKAFRISEFAGLTQTISRPLGVVWLISFLLFGLLLLLFFKEKSYWWATGIGAILVSQTLIFIFWQDAKIGTLPNVIILLACIIGWSNFNFKEKIKKEREVMFSKNKVGEIIDIEQSYNYLPVPVQKWLTNNQVFEKQKIDNVYLQQQVKMKLKPEQEEWKVANAEQYFTIDPPAFNWSLDLQMNPILTLKGRDRFEEGKGEMLMKILSIIPVVDVKENLKINQAALQRYLAEIIWFPSAALSSYIKWEYVDEQSAKATMTYKGTSGSGLFHFDDNGDFEKFTTMRYKDSDDDAQQYEWIAEVIENGVINKNRVPVKLKVTWKLESMDWNWLELEITKLKYNSQKPLADKINLK